MIKSLLSNIIILFSLLFSLTVKGENNLEGTWYFHPTYTTPPQKVLETDRERVYYLSGGNLFSYDNKDDENYAYTINNKLSDSDITNIYYNFDRHYLLVCYSSGNIDLLYDDGSTKNLSDIKESTINPPLTITGAAFDGDYIYVSTSFGVVKFNEKRGEVVTSGIYKKHVNSVAIIGENLVIHCEGNFYFTEKDTYLNSFETFAQLHSYETPKEMWNVGDTLMMVYVNSAQNYITSHKIDFQSQTLQEIKRVKATRSKLPEYIIHGEGGKVYYQADNNLYSINERCEETKEASLQGDLEESLLTTYTGANSLWSLKKQGLGHYSVDAKGEVTVMMERFLPDAFSVNQVRYFFPSMVNTRLYAQNNGSTSYRFGTVGPGYQYAQTAGYVDMATGEYKDVTVYPVEAKSSLAQQYQREQHGLYAVSPTAMAENPLDPSEYFLATATDGVYKVKDGKFVGRYDNINSPMKMYDNRFIVFGMSIDRGGNLWVTTHHNSYSVSPLMILPANKVKLDPSEVKIEDWYYPDLKEIAYWGSQDVQIHHCKKASNITFIIQGNSELFVYDNRGTLDNFSDDRVHLWEEMYDQDGKQLDPHYFTAITEDSEGRVWLGCYQGGVVMIQNPAKALDENMVFTHVKVPRNDGSNLADYLLSSDQIMDITVDVANRKWIATYGSGLFLVSPSGDKILENFTTENSLLPTDKLNCVYADPNGPTVYVGTDYGLLSYTSDATPTCEDFSQILAYPNPVKPDYHGDINITGLMNNTLVKISDSSGSVIYQGKSEGGRFVWNGCNASGSRVPTGVYYVFVSSGGGHNGGESASAVTKIMVVN